MSTTRRPLCKLLAGYGILFFINGSYFTWSILAPYFAGLAPQWSAAQLALPAAINVAASALGGLAATGFLRRLGPRGAIRASGAFLAGGWLTACLLFWLPHITVLCLGYTLIGFGTGIMYPVVGKVLTACYPSRSGTISGSLLLVSGLGALFVGAMEESLIPALGLYGLCLLLAGLDLVTIFVCGQRMTLPEEDKSPLGQGAGEEPAQLKRDMGTPVFGIFFLWLILLSSGGLLVINNAGMIFSDYHAPPAAGMLTTLAMGAGCQVMGTAVDRFGLRMSMLGAALLSLLTSVLLLAGHWRGVEELILAGTLLCGSTYGTTTSAKMAGIIELYGSRHMTAYFGVFNLSIFPASFLGPYFSGWLLMLGQGWYPAFLFLTGLSLLSLFLVFVGWRFLHRKAPAEENGGQRTAV